MSAAVRFPCTANQVMVARLLNKGYVSNVPFLLRATGHLRLDILRDALQLVVDAVQPSLQVHGHWHIPRDQLIERVGSIG